MADEPNPWTLPPPRPKRAKAPRKAPARARPATKRPAAKRPARKSPPRRKAAKALPAQPAPEQVRRPREIDIPMRRVEPLSRAERLAAMRKTAVAAAPAPAALPLAAGVAPGAPAVPAPAPAEARPKRRSRLRAFFALGIVVALALVAAAAMPAMSQGNSGTIKVHDGSGADPDERNEPHVTGDAFVEGFNMAAGEGDLLLYSWPPTGNMTLALATTWDGDDAEPAVHFLAGPFDLPCGHYRAFAYNGDGPEDPAEPQPGGAKKKTFWVDCETPPGENPPIMACPTDLVAVANGDGSVTLSWTPAPGSVGSNVYRADDGGDFEYLATVGQDVGTYTDATTTPGTGYEYLVTGLYGDQESQQCGVVEVTAIPEFPTLAAMGLATGGGALAMLLLRRRK